MGFVPTIGRIASRCWPWIAVNRVRERLAFEPLRPDGGFLIVMRVAL